MHFNQSRPLDRYNMGRLCHDNELLLLLLRFIIRNALDHYYIIVYHIYTTKHSLTAGSV